jgi:hypothetical protein
VRERPSQVVLPVIPNPPAGIPAALPACGSLRGEPCRAALGNGAASAVSATLHRHDALVEWTAASSRHFFEVTAIYSGGVTVAATPSNTVSPPHRHRGHRHHKPHHPHDGHTPASGRAGARF